MSGWREVSLHTARDERSAKHGKRWCIILHRPKLSSNGLGVPTQINVRGRDKS
ncbi:hypothetical protein M413DRAFT_437955 [Hebeloma cylindrosporum]|uniref:Uncharacterized protein n=1 Tax=Hebeloma cylindrosporum TaxID=76867 RepID=A0A0C3CY68_HEBCY|nr:hypothetical protein M413DRAFT_437955 [Hebeloma cylindrosporum h7]